MAAKRQHSTSPLSSCLDTMTSSLNGNARPEVLVLGFGAVGTLYSYIFQKGGANVTAVCRSNYDVVRKHGMHVVSDKFGEVTAWRPTRVIRTADDLDSSITLDYVVCSCKCLPDVVPNSEVMRPFLTKNLARKPTHLPTVLLLQNGIDIEHESYERLVKSDPPLASSIVSANTWVPATLREGGSRMEHGLLEVLSMGVYPAPLDAPVPAETQASLELLLLIALRGGSSASITNDITAERWRKVLWNISWGGVTVLARRPLLEMLQVEMLPYTIGSVRGIMLEMLAVARASGLGEDRLPASIIDQTMRQTMTNSPAQFRLPTSPDMELHVKRSHNFPSNFKPSILVDLDRERPMELEPIFVNILRRARRMGVDTPRLDLIATALKPSQLLFVRRQQNQDPDALMMQEGIYNLSSFHSVSGNAPVSLF